MKYSKGFKYQLKETLTFPTAFRPEKKIETQFIILDTDGYLTILKGYAWDGASGPTIDDELFKLCSLPHDALYQLMRMGLLDHKEWRKADMELKRVVDFALKSGELSWMAQIVWPARIVWVMKGLEMVKGKAADPEQRREVYEIKF